MSVPGVQTALAVAPPSAVQISPSVAVLDGPDGGMVLVNGFAAYCWDRGDDVLRRFAAVGASMLPDVTDVAVAAAFSTSTVSLWRWRRSAQTDGPAALVRRRPGPRGPSKLTPALRTEVDALRARGASIAVIAERLGVSTFTVRVALGRVPGRVMPGGTGAGAADSAGGDADAGDPAGADADADGGIGTAAEARSGGGTGGLTDIDVGNDRGDDPDAGDAPAGLECEIGAADPVDAGAGVPTGADADADGDAGAVAEAGSEGGTADLADDDGDTDGGTAPDAGDVPAGVAEIEVATAGLVGHAAVLPVLPDPVDRSIERASARWGLLPYAPPVFAPAARVPLAGLFLAVPALAATGLLEGARQVYGGVPHGFYGLDAMLCEAVFRTMLGQPRAEGATRVNPTDLGRVLGLDRAPEVKTVRRKMALLAARGKAAQLLTVQARRHVADHEEATSVLYVDGHVRTYHGKRKIQKTHVSRLRFPAPATVETWIA
ncbi:MAG TPA: helix-turn-helix domain-containing protein, partial [Nakamurella sp.]